MDGHPTQRTKQVAGGSQGHLLLCLVADDLQLVSNVGGSKLELGQEAGLASTRITNNESCSGAIGHCEEPLQLCQLSSPSDEGWHDASLRYSPAVHSIA